MPQDGSNNYQYPPGTPGIPDQTLESEAYNTFLDDLVVNDLNWPRPVHRGGTGGSTANKALINLASEKATQLVTNYDAHVWLPGSFYSSTATGQGAPIDGHAFAGICYLNEPYIDPPTNENVIVEARDLDGEGSLSAVYVRHKNEGVWGDWIQQVAGSTRNRIVNGAMQISQENGNTTSGIVTSFAYYPSDQWAGYWSIPPGTAAILRVQLVTPNGSTDRLRLGIGTPKASLAASDYVLIRHPIEGNRIADFQWGTASAKQVILRFGWSSPAGTYSIKVGNAPSALRSYIANFTISAGQANIATEQTIIIPGDITGSWLTDTSSGLVVDFVVAMGSDYLGVAGWNAGNPSITASNSNGAEAVGSFELFDVGLYLDTDSTGVAPRWEMPDPVAELTTCQRYFSIVGFARQWVSVGLGYTDVTSYPFSVSPRASPTVTLHDISFTGVAGDYAAIPSSNNVRFYMTASGSGVSNVIASANIRANARL